MFWFEKEDARALFMDIREGEWIKDYGTPMSAGRKPIVVRPNVIGDFVAMPFPDSSFYMVVFDPPHHTSTHFGGNSSIMQNSYGVLLPGWEEMLRKGFEECFRVLREHGTLIFKWASREIPLSRVLALTDQKPLFGHRSGKKAHTHWVAFLKQSPNGLGVAGAQLQGPDRDGASQQTLKQNARTQRPGASDAPIATESAPPGSLE